MGQVSIDIAAPPERVWDLVADVTNMGRWSPETVSAQWVDGAEGPAVGARFKGKNTRKRSWSTTCTVVDAERGRAFAFDAGKDTRWRYDLEATPGGCRVTESYELLRQPGAVGRWLTKVGTGVTWADRAADLTRGMEQTLARLKSVAEDHRDA
jgi:uncharacterized protein YndB with AHSA1/START domain